MNFDVLLLGSDINAYYMARNFHEEYDIKSYVLGRVPMMFTSLSKIINLEINSELNNEEKFVDILIKKAKEINNKKIILIGCNDNYVSLIIKYKKELSKYYLFNYIDEELLNNIVIKENFYKTFGNVLDIPKTYIYSCQKEFDFKKIKEYLFPIILKPSDGVKYHECEFEGQAKVYKLNSNEEITKVITNIKDSGYDGNLIIQEFIPGDDSQLFDVIFYCGTDKKAKAMTLAQIALQEHTITGIGNCTVLVNGFNEHNNTEEIKDKLIKFIESIDFQGCCEFDLKYDVRDNKFKVFEINPRQARSSYYLTACGHNLAKYFVDDLIYKKDMSFTFIDKKVVLSFVPRYVINKYVNNKILKTEIDRLLRENNYIDPLKYSKDMSLKRREWLLKRKLNYIKKYKENTW